MKVDIVNNKPPIHIGQLFLGTVFLWNNEAYVKCTTDCAINLHNHAMRQFSRDEHITVAESVTVKVSA